MPLTHDQLTELVILYGECGRQATATANLYNERFQDGPRVNRRQVTTIVSRLRETGSFQRRRPVNRVRPVATAAVRDNILAAVALNPHTSSRVIGRALNISHQTALRVLHDHHFHPYHMHLHQALDGGDFRKREAFCTWLDTQVDDDPTFLQQVMWTDEATFSRDGNVNTHNAHYWSAVNPHWLRETDHQERFSVNVWCAIVHDTVFGPVFLPPRLNGVRFLHLLRTDVAAIIDGRPVGEELWFQMDGAPAHYHVVVRDHLDEVFPARWIGRGGPVSWPPRSPDLTPLDFFLWGYIKERVYRTAPLTVADLQERIVAACGDVTPQMLQNVRRSIVARARCCLTVEGRHFEHYLSH